MPPMINMTIVVTMNVTVINSVGSDDVIVQLNPTQENLDFLSSHRGQCFTKLSHLKNWVVPMIMMYYNGARLCSIFKLQIHDNECDDSTHDQREDYPKIALMMFYSF